MTQIEKIYNSERFRSEGHKLIDLLADHLSTSLNKNYHKAIPYSHPEESYERWQNIMEEEEEDITSFFAKVIDNSTKLHDPRYLGHQVGVVAPISALASLASALINNGMAVYEMGLVSNPLERYIIELMAQKIGYDRLHSGILTSGGTIATLTALLTARAKLSNAWSDGMQHLDLAVIVSDEAHYAVDRAARIMGIGSDGIIKIPTDAHYRMDTTLLTDYYNQAKTNGKSIIAIVSSACSTSTGSYDDILSVDHFAKANNIWHHIDGAHGGCVIFSEKYKHLVEGCNLADSIVIDWHKMLMVPALATAVLYKNGDDSYETFHQKAQYLWQNAQSKDWYNSGKRTMECTKLMMSLKIAALLKQGGTHALQQYVDSRYDICKDFASYLCQREDYKIAVTPQSNILCFKKIVDGNIDRENFVNKKIRELLLLNGKYYIVQTELRKEWYLRVSIMNPFTQLSDLKNLLDEIEECINQIL